MVHFKVTDGSQTRRLEAPSGLTYEGLKKKLSSLFPDTVKEDSDLVLHYRDADGDVVTLSSDQELQEVLSTAKDIKFFLPKSATSRKPQSNRCGSLFPSLWAQGWNFEKELEEFSQLLDTLAGHRQSSSTEAAATGKESSSESHVSDTPRTETADTATPQTEAGDDEEVRSKLAAEPTNSEEGVNPKSSSNEGEEVKSKLDPKSVPTKEGTRTREYCVYGGLAPLLLSDILFRPPVPRAVGYRITWSPCGFQCAC